MSRFLDISRTKRDDLTVKQYIKTVKEIRKLLERDTFDPIDTCFRAFGEAIASPLKKQWEEVAGLRESSGVPCPERLTKHRCSCGWSHELAPGSDHTSLWLENGKPKLYITQPYDLSYEKMKELVAFCEEKGLRVDVHGRGSWHFPGYTLKIVIAKNKPNEKD